MVQTAGFIAFVFADAICSSLAMLGRHFVPIAPRYARRGASGGDI